MQHRVPNVNPSQMKTRKIYFALLISDEKTYTAFCFRVVEGFLQCWQHRKGFQMWHIIGHQKHCL